LQEKNVSAPLPSSASLLRARKGDDARQAAILDALPAGIALLDDRGEIVSVNAAWTAFGAANGGYSCRGMNYLDICDAARGADASEAASAAAGLRAVLDGSLPGFSLEYPCHSPTVERWFRLVAAPIPDGNGRSAVAMHIDITRERQSAAALAAMSDSTAQRERILGKTLSSISDFVQTYRRDGRLLFVNQPLLELWGMTLDQVVGKDFAELGYPAALAARLQGQLQYVFATGQNVTDEAAFTGASGVEGLYEYIFAPVLAPDGSVEFVVGSTRDITARKLAEASVVRSEKHLRGLIDGVGASIFVGLLTPQGVVMEINAMSLAQAGLQRDDVIGMAFEDTHWWTDPAARERLRGAIARAAQGEESHYDERILDKDGNRVDIDFSLRPVRDELGAVAWLVPSASVITERSTLARQLSEERTRLVAAQRVAKVGSWETNLVDGTTLWSEETHRIHGTDPATFVPTHAAFLQLVHPDDRAGLDATFLASLPGCERSMAQHRLLLAGGRVKYLEENWCPERDGTSQAVRVIGTCQDITERKLAEIRIERLNHGYIVLSQINALIVRAADRNDLFRETCRIAVEAGGFKMAWIGLVDEARSMVVAEASAGGDEVLERIVGERLSLADDAPPGHGPSARAVRERRAIVVNDVANDPAIVDGARHAAGGLLSLVSLPLVVAGEVVGVLGLHAGDIDYFDDGELELLQELANDVAFAMDHIDKAEKLTYLAYYDVLTGLANRPLFFERAAQCLRSAAEAGHGSAMVLIDLERFKSINDSLGQAAGDALLRQVAAWLRANLADESLLARVDADHFVAMLPHAHTPSAAARQLDGLVEAFHEHLFDLDGTPSRIAARFGVAVYPDDATDVRAMFMQAESATKNAKREGRRHLFYTQAMTESVARTLSTENRLRRALDNREFVLHYQTKVNAATGKLDGVEALLRWNDPSAGLVAPLQFIPILEQTGMIRAVGRWALQQAIDDHARWRAAGVNVRIAVNVSALQLRDPGFAADLATLLEGRPGAAAGLEIEITESMVMADVEQSLAALQAIREMGVRIAIDDFGTGFSSLAYLSRLPVDSLKIDRSFVTDMTKSPAGLSLVSIMITLAHSLGLKVVAEGVETEDEANLLRLLRCDEMQGFLFSRPVAASVLERDFLAA
jgi:diguanylate cyclase (GGDEF)-like protein/PAS domain S-box-containing protein